MFKITTGRYILLLNFVDFEKNTFIKSTESNLKVRKINRFSQNMNENIMGISPPVFKMGQIKKQNKIHIIILDYTNLGLFVFSILKSFF